MASPIGIAVPTGGSCCSKCEYVGDDARTCESPDYVRASYQGKEAGDNRFIDGKTGKVVENPSAFCCNFFDWTKGRRVVP